MRKASWRISGLSENERFARFLMFGWLFGFAPLVVAILKSKYNWPKRVGVFLLVAFMLFNIYMIDPTAWDARAEGVPAATSEEDYALANTIDFSSGKIFGPQSAMMAIYDVHNNLGTICARAYIVTRRLNGLKPFEFLHSVPIYRVFATRLGSARVCV